MPRAKAEATEPKKLITPTLTINGEKHPLEELEALGKLPLMKSVGIIKVNNTAEPYTSYIVTSKGGQVIDIEVSGMNAKGISFDELKINVVNLFVDGGLELMS